MRHSRPPFRLLFVGSLAATGEERFLSALEAALRGGADAFLLREKATDGGDLLRLAREARARTSSTGALLLVTDRIDVALAAGADGVQLPESSFTSKEARRLLGPGPLIGRSVHDLAGARRAEEDGADFVIAGPLFPTPGKERVLGLSEAARIRAALRIPVVPIGGINAATVPALRAAGFDSAAVIRAIAAAEDPEAAAHAIRSLLEAGPA